MPSRICSILDCGRVHYAKGLCERHYRARLRKSRVSYVSGHDSAANAPNKEVKVAEFPGSAGGRAGDDRPRTSPAPSFSGEELNRLTSGEGRPALVTGVNRGTSIRPEGRAALPQRFGVIRWT